jgi:RND family efflux transporter MFP subunit
LGGCSFLFTQTASNSENRPPEVKLPVVEAVQSRKGALPLSERLNGTVIAQNQVALYPEISGKIVRVLARNGDFVREGDPLVILDDSQYREQLKQAEASLRVDQAALSQAKARYSELEAMFKRTVELAEEGLSSRVEVETLQAQIDSAKASIELAEAQIQESSSVIQETKTVMSKTEIRAPIDGTIGRRRAEVGMQVSTGTELFTIGDLSRLKIEVVLTSQVLNNVRAGQAVKIYAVSGNGRQEFDASLSRISPFLDPVTRSTEAEIDIRNRDYALIPGMSVTAEILYGQSGQATLLPSSAIFTHPVTGQEGVYLLSKSDSSPESTDNSLADQDFSSPANAEFRPVQVVAEGRMEVGVNGLDPDSWVVTLGQNLLAEGKSQAHVRATSWDRVIELQQLQREDLLEEVLSGD